MLWNDIQITQRQAKYPAEVFVRFVARNYYARDRSKTKFLDLGCGSGSNAWFLIREGFDVVAIDSSEAAIDTLKHRLFEEHRAQLGKMIVGDFTGWQFKTKFDCVLDHNTLCHVESAPKVLHNIYESLVTGGKLFSVAPADDTWRGTLAGKGYCRCSTRNEIKKLYSMFDSVKIGKQSYPDGEFIITSWIVEATK